MIPAAKLVDGPERGGGQAGGQALGLIEQHNAACDVMELAAVCWPV